MADVNLIHPIPVTVQIWDTTKQSVDTPAREPIHGPRSSQTAVIRAQIQWSRKAAPQYQAAGVVGRSEGYIITTRAELKAKGVTLKRGDEITQIGAGVNAQTGLHLFITQDDPAAHYPEAGGNLLVMYRFEDRKPGREP